jgi:hypothetical protein
MGKFDEKKRLAQAMYIKGTLSRKDIAAAVSITEKTLRNWIDLGEWDNLKEACTVTRQQLLADSYAQLSLINQAIADKGGVPDKVLYDAKSVIGKEIERLSSSPLHKYVEVIDEFTEFIAKTVPGKITEITKLTLEFLNKKQDEQ